MDAPLLTADFKEFLKYAVGLHGYPRATVDLDIEGLPVPVISLADLKTNKRAAGRHKDLADLDNLP